MCSIKHVQVISVDGNKATVQNGRTIHLGGMKGVQKGDTIAVYADVAVEKVEERKGELF